MAHQYHNLGVKLTELAEVICQLRAELERARAAATDEVLRFELGPIDLEVTVALEATGGAEAKVRFWVVEIGGEAGATSSSTQRINAAVAAPESDRRSAYVSGADEPGER